MAVLGVPREDHGKMLQLTAEFFGGADPEMQREEFRGLPDAASRQWAATVQEFYGFFQQLRDQRRESAQDDLTTFVNTLEAGGEPWPEHIRNGFLATVAPAGIDTTKAAIAERALRGPVIHRKLSHGTQSDTGQRFAEPSQSAATTCRLQRRSPFTYLSELIATHSRGNPFPALT